MPARRRNVFLCWGALLWLALWFASQVTARAAGAPASKHVGGLVLAPCAHGAYCGRIDRPLDPTGLIRGRILIYFEFYPHTAAGPAVGTLAATEGGPGYPATGSRRDYLALFAPLRATRDVLIMDNRGTGHSGALDCRALQTAPTWTVELIAACGESLGERASLYSTAYAADDLAAVLRALDIAQIDLYGDSYGTYFEQVFAVRHPALLRSLVLDGAYPLYGPDYPWYPTYAPAMRAKFTLACERSAGCARRPGSFFERLDPLLAQLRRAPARAQAKDSDGTVRTFNADASQLATLMFAAAPALATVKELDAAGRAFLNEDRAPLLRLMAETVSGVDSRDPSADILKWSAGLAAAVMCQDPPQIFDMALPPALRLADRDRALAQRRRAFPDTYAPFSIDEFRGMPLDYSFLDQCVAWPVAPPGHRASQVVPDGAPYPDIPALVLSGELDDITTPADGAAVARKFPRGRQVLIANSFHVNALPRARSTCGARLVRQFIEDPTLTDAACATEVAPVPLVQSFARHASELDPALALGTNDTADAGLRWVAAAVWTAGDALTRLASNSTGKGDGLRGGRFRILRGPHAAHLTLIKLKWTEDLAVSGTIDAFRDSMRTVRARLTLASDTNLSGELEVRWQSALPDAQADIRGMLAGRRVRARMSAP